MPNLAGKMYYDPKVNLIFQVKEVDGSNYDDTLIIGEPCHFYLDAKTCVVRYQISVKYLDNCVPLKNLVLQNDIVRTYHKLGFRVRNPDSDYFKPTADYTYMKELTDKHYKDYNSYNSNSYVTTKA